MSRPRRKEDISGMVLPIRLTDAEFAILKECAEHLGQTASEFIRSAALDKARKYSLGDWD